jgi:hypothetical protein
MVIPEHTAKAFDVDRQRLTCMVAEMGGLTDKQIADSFQSRVKSEVTQVGWTTWVMHRPCGPRRRADPITWSLLRLRTRVQ